MMARLRELQAGWKAAGRPVLEIGIGINSGIASVGNMGSQLRYGYTAMGDSVNLASRLEGLNKDFGTRILLSEFTFAQIADAKFVARELDLIRVKGKLQPVKIYELLVTTPARLNLLRWRRNSEGARQLYADEIGARPYVASRHSSTNGRTTVPPKCSSIAAKNISPKNRLPIGMAFTK